MRIGFGYDVHRLVKNRKLILGGVEIPFEKGLLGHSDADVLVHSIIDAILGAANLGDIGEHFPNNKEQYVGISSLTLLKKVFHLLKEKGYHIINIDSTIVAERPHIKKYIPSMKTNIASILQINQEDVSIKATTEEGLGISGNEQGIAAYAVVLII
ncbi:MAG: 2-C-methyl-D-erythritol 2,4-cyclodiphosphate synthase [Candidatus Cloacimonadota bacterium]|nr:MAG: 2-C-methyl-D-erythritol 2,4-cyclodiphosphate synthase [Candidatus Cloacimonadota bacterium]